MKTIKRIQHWALLSAILLTMLVPVGVLANAGFFDNGAAGITLGNTDKIQMVSEVVEITFSPADGPVTGNLKHRDKAHYNCRFVLKNLSDETISAQVGFPLIGGVRRPDPARHPDIKNFFLDHYGFTAQSGDTVYAVREHFNKDAQEYRRLLVWDMEFAPGATLELEVSYSIYGYNGVGSTEKLPYNHENRYRKYYLQDLELAVMQMYPYVTKTAGSWAGKVESAEFIIRRADFEAHLKQRSALEKDGSPKRANESENNRLRLTQLDNGTLYRHITAGNWQEDADGKTLRWTEAPFTDHQDFEICYIFSVMPQNTEGFGALLKMTETNHERDRSNLLKGLEKAQALPKSDPQRKERIRRTTHSLKTDYPTPFGDEDRKNIADAVLEFYGIPTRNPDISDFLERQNWYPVAQPRPIDPVLKAELLRWHNIDKQ